jgi:pimeloyl-ACP methyl ester carboxylesterase
MYPDLPGMGRTPAPAALQSSDDVLDVLLDLVDALGDGDPVLLVGHSAGAYYARELAARRADRVHGLALVCPLLSGVRDVPDHRPVVADDALGDEEFRGYFVVQTPAMLERYERFVKPAVALVDAAAAERIGARWELSASGAPAYAGPTLVVAGRQDSVVGYLAAVDLLEVHPQATLAVLDGAGHALPHEQPALLAGLLLEWLGRCGVAR